MRHPPIVSCVAFTLLASACTEPIDDDSLDDTTQAIIAGNPASADGGYVLLDLPSGICSGTMISREWVLTARHCFDLPLPAPSGTIIRLGAQAIPAAEVIRHPTLDAALVRASSALMIGSPPITGFDRGLWRGTAASLVGRLTQCVGYGLNDIDGPDVGGGTIRTAALPIDRLDGPHLVLLPSIRGQILAPGDSGSSCLNHDSSGQQVIIGVANHVTAELDPGPPQDLEEIFDAYLLAAPQLRTWISEVTIARELRFGNECVDTTLGSRTSGSPLRTFPCQGTPSQRWRTVGVGNGSGQLQNVDSGRCMHVAAAGVLQQVDCDAVAPTNPNQVFALQPHASGGTRVVASSGSCVRVDAANRLVHAACGGAFDIGASAMISSVPSVGHRTLHVSSSSECIDVPWGDSSPGVGVNHFPCHDGTAQEWNLVATATLGAFQIRPRANSGLCLRDNLTSVTQEPCGASTLQHWKLRPQSNGGYQLTTSTGTCLTAPSGVSALSTTVCTFNAADQRWHLRWH